MKTPIASVLDALELELAEERYLQRLVLAKELWQLHLQAHRSGAHDMAVGAYRAHFNAVERLAQYQCPNLWRDAR